MADTSTIGIFLGSSGAIGAFVSAATFAASWLHDHDAAETSRKDLASLAGRATFWKIWLDAQGIAGLSEDQLSRAKQTAATELESLSEVMRQMTSQKAKESLKDAKAKAAVGPLRRFFLLYWPPRSGGIWALRVFFYYCLIAPELFPFVFRLQTPQLPLDASEVLGLFISSWIWALLLRWLIVVLERRKLAQSSK